MVEIPESLRSMFSATVEKRGEMYVLEVPQSEVDHGALTPGETYRIGVLTQQLSSTEATDERTTQSPQSSAKGGSEPPTPPVTEGEVRDVTIETVGDQGDGLAKVERGYVVIIPGAQPGDEPTVEIDQVQENVAFASVVDSDPRAL
ncbi:TRAM domain-containing protein [Halobacterium salinarum]|uniref:TRAM domain-containing protein n=1 Tax=Halobacterium salinarum TaxID=2242 RepID=UPI002555E598|nr:TRAM domain-containing protein [Halobacterium salinarum]MDL0140752.1 TRAM domain-containing protein [Halobacterium salinarum]